MPNMPTPRLTARATRSGGKRTRADLLQAATELFLEHGLNGVSVKEIAQRCDCFPSQIQYYFGDKESLFVEAMCAEVLVVRARVERAASRASEPDAAVRAMIREAQRSPALLRFVEATLLVNRRDDLAPLVRETFSALHSRAARGAASVMASHGWEVPDEPGVRSRAFWSTIIGLTLERAAIGDGFDEQMAEEIVRAVTSMARPAS
jgi:TetR/AcrR family transcriptional regulator, regulator of cefoperazone and chloramphenicol sensitivity